MKKHVALSLFALTLGFTSLQAQAAGFHLSEYTTTGLGRAFSGTGVVGDDFSALGFNPAGMQYNKTSGGQIGATVVSLHSDYKGEIDTYPTARSGRGHTRPTRVLPNVFAQQKINDKATIGLGAYVPFGLATDYHNGWFAESHAAISQVSATNVSPSVSYQLNDMVALGAAVNFQYITARLGSVVETTMEGQLPKPAYLPGSSNDLRGDDLGVGYTIGTTITPRKDVRLGVSYRSKIKHKLEGDVKTAGTPDPTRNIKQDIFTKIKTPEVLTFSGAYDINRCFTVSATARWTRWSQFDRLDIYKKSDGKMLMGTNENWKNTWYYAAGVDYRYNPNWTFRTGLGYDETTIKAPEYRTARIPDGPRILTSLGLSYAKDNWQIDTGYTHIFMHGTTGYGKSEGASDINMRYHSDADLFSVGLQYKF